MFHTTWYIVDDLCVLFGWVDQLPLKLCKWENEVSCWRPFLWKRANYLRLMDRHYVEVDRHSLCLSQMNSLFPFLCWCSWNHLGNPFSWGKENVKVSFPSSPFFWDHILLSSELSPDLAQASLMAVLGGPYGVMEWNLDWPYARQNPLDSPFLPSIFLKIIIIFYIWLVIVCLGVFISC